VPCYMTFHKYLNSSASHCDCLCTISCVHTFHSLWSYNTRFLLFESRRLFISHHHHLVGKASSCRSSSLIPALGTHSPTVTILESMEYINHRGWFPTYSLEGLTLGSVLNHPMASSIRILLNILNCIGNSIPSLSHQMAHTSYAVVTKRLLS